MEHKLHVPIGIISSSYGGSKIEAWMSKEKLANYPEPLKEASQSKIAIQNKASQLFNGMVNHTGWIQVNLQNIAHSFGYGAWNVGTWV